MNTTEILAALPNLDAEERAKVFRRLCELREADVLRGEGPSPEEKRILDEASAEFHRDGDTGEPWHDVVTRLASAALDDE